MGSECDKVLKVKAVALFSGGLDSILAVRLIQESGIDVRGVTFETPFFSALKAKDAAERIGLPLTIIDFTEAHLEMLRAPRYGYGRNMNPCIDCHTLMLKHAGRFMEEIGACFIITGEVLGQRPMSQGKQSLYVVAKNSGYQDYIVRPLSAKLLPVTKPEQDGLIDRERLMDIQGRGRKTQMRMADQFGVTTYTNPAGGCLLTDPEFSKRLKELFENQPGYSIRDIELLKYGRHFRLADGTKVVVGRNKSDNEGIKKLHKTGDMLVRMENYPGPTVLITGGCSDEALRTSSSLCALYSDAPKDQDVAAVCRTGEESRSISTRAASRETAAGLII